MKKTNKANFKKNCRRCACCGDGGCDGGDCCNPGFCG